MGTMTAKPCGTEYKVQHGVPSAGLKILTSGTPLVAAPAMHAPAVQQLSGLCVPIPPPSPG